uniref:Uncharacterized protein n=1 Tax=Timema poppense TaxID=170557 RepID=A0A7R9HEB4_TIMPO|nr:unnamed protein product [Timema poppensis]
MEVTDWREFNQARHAICIMASAIFIQRVYRPRRQRKTVACESPVTLNLPYIFGKYIVKRKKVDKIFMAYPVIGKMRIIIQHQFKMKQWFRNLKKSPESFQKTNQPIGQNNFKPATKCTVQERELLPERQVFDQIDRTLV